MSCLSTRTLHNICVPGCVTSACPCPATAVFACKPLCPCPELEDNLFFTQAQLVNLVCSAVDTAIAEGCTGPFGSTNTFGQCLIDSGLLVPPVIPAFGCPVVIGVTGPSPGAVVVGTLVNGVFTVIPNNLSLIGLYRPTINGQVCGIRTVSIID